MIQKIKVSGLKSIDTIELDCKKLNVITGTNSSGKSTLLQAIMLFFQSHRGLSLRPSESGLNGKYISLGEFRENKNPYSTDINIKLQMDNRENCYSTVYFKTGDAQDCLVESIEDCNNNFEFYVEDVWDRESTVLKHLSCNRIGAQDVYNKDYNGEGIGKNGEHAIYYLEMNKSLALAKELIKDDSSETLSSQVNYWLEYIVNTTIKTEDIIGTDIVKATYSVADSSYRRPKNVGSGISYLISILVLCLSSTKDDILIIENPEIHLHPKAQSKVCEFLYFIADSGVQIFVETHSDHIFNGIRAGIATNEMKTDNVTVNFFNLNDKECTENSVIEFGPKGQIKNAPAGLFDQFDVDLDRMLGLN